MYALGPHRPVMPPRFAGKVPPKMVEKRPKAKSFDEFWPQYLKAHSKKVTRSIHYVGTTGGLVAGAVAIATGNILLAPIAVVGTYGLLFSSHFIFEKNKPETLRHPLWSMRADFKMLRLFLTGKIKGELEKLNTVQKTESSATEPKADPKKPE